MHTDVIPPLSGGRYQLFQVLGSGGMATVYRAYDRSLDIERAIKVLAPHLVARSVIRERFATEARTMARLHHPNIVSVHDVGSDGDRLFIVMEYLNGGDIHGRLEKMGVYPQKMSSYVIKGMFAGLQVAHDNGVTHRDIKPHNVLISAEHIPKVTDFGIAQVADTNSGLTRTGVVMGTLAYMAPEQRTGARNADNRSDIYAVAATLYNMLTAAEPFDLYSVEVREDMLKEVGEPLASIIRKGCSYKTDQRYQSCTEMIAAMEEVEDQLPELDPSYPPLALPPPDTHDTQVPLAPSGSGISVETFDSSIAVSANSGERQRSDPFGNFSASGSGSASSFSEPNSVDTNSGATFFPMEMDDPPTVEVLPSTAAVSQDGTVPATKNSKSALVLALGGVLIAAVLGGVIFLSGKTVDEASNTQDLVAIARIEATATREAEQIEKSTIDILKKVEVASKLELEESAPSKESVQKVEEVRENVKTHLLQVAEVADSSRQVLKEVLEKTPALQEKINIDQLDNLVDLEEAGLESLISELPPSVKAMVQRQWEHDNRVQRLEEATSALEEKTNRLALALEASVAAERSKEAQRSAAVVAPVPHASAEVVAPAHVDSPPIPPPVSGDVAFGKLMLNARPYSKFYLDGKEVVMANRKPIEVPVGRHELIVQDQSSARRKVMEIVVTGSRTSKWCWDFNEEREYCQ